MDDHPVVREGIALLLSRAADLALCGVAATLAEAQRALPAAQADVVLLDLDLAGQSGLELLPWLAAEAPAAKALVLTGMREREVHHAALVAGARGILPKETAPELLLKAIRKVHAGELWFDRALMETALRRSLDAGRRADPEREKIASLTPRERELVALLGEGLKNDQIALRLGITEKTVRNQLSTVFDKLGVSDRLELVVYAYRNGLAQVPR